jgi:hypothetical protein
MQMKERLKDLASAVLGGGIGYLSSLYGEAVARANIAVRPELAKVDWITAFLAGHIGDWLYYHYPNEMRIVGTVAGCVGLYAIYKILKD